MAIIVKEASCWNPNYGYNYDPDTVEFFEVGAEVCDANFIYVQDNLDEAGGAFLPGLLHCPWESFVVDEVTVGCETPTPTTTYPNTTPTATPTATPMVTNAILTELAEFLATEAGEILLQEI